MLGFATTGTTGTGTESEDEEVVGATDSSPVPATILESVSTTTAASGVAGGRVVILSKGSHKLSTSLATVAKLTELLHTISEANN